MTDHLLKISNSFMGGQNYFPKFETSVSKDGTTESIQKTAVLSTKDLASQETKSKADVTLMEKYGMLTGSLKKAFSDKSGNISLAVQVLSFVKKSIISNLSYLLIPGSFSEVKSSPAI